MTAATTGTLAPTREARERAARERHAAREPRRAAAPTAMRSLRALAGEQIAVAAGQVAAGVGNLAFSLLAARLLAPGAFADLAAFLALYLVLHVPTASLSAGRALRPALADSARRRVALIGGGVAAVLAAPRCPPRPRCTCPRACCSPLPPPRPRQGCSRSSAGACTASAARAVRPPAWRSSLWSA
jgi:hypothetical protein